MEQLKGTIVALVLLGLAWSTVFTDHSTWNLLVSVLWGVYITVIALIAVIMFISAAVVATNRENLVTQLKLGSDSDRAKRAVKDKTEFDAAHKPLKVLTTALFAGLFMGTCVYLQWGFTLTVYTLSLIVLHVGMLIVRSTYKKAFEEAGLINDEEVDSI